MTRVVIKKLIRAEEGCVGTVNLKSPITAYNENNEFLIKNLMMRRVS